MAVLRERGDVFASLEKDQLVAVYQAYESALRTVASYVPTGPVPGDLVFFTAQQGRTADAATAESWQPYVGGTIEDHPLDVEHHSLMETPAAVAAIGAVLNAKLK
jgi:thioesterase domain-containing protein